MAARKLPPSQIDLTFKRALAAHHEGNLRRAEDLYRAVILAVADHAEAHHHLGILVAGRNVTAALPLLKSALELDPSRPRFWFSYIEALWSTGRTEEAHGHLRQALSQGFKGREVERLAHRLGLDVASPVENWPDHLATLRALYESGKHVDVLAQAEAMLAKKQDIPLVWKVVGASLQKCGYDRASFVAKRKAIVLQPEDPENYGNFANSLNGLGLFGDGATSGERAVRIAPASAEARNSFSVSLYGRSRIEEAEAQARIALTLLPSLDTAHNSLGNCLRVRGHNQLARLAYDRALVIDPGAIHPLVNCAALHRDNHELDSAVSLSKRVLVLKPAQCDALYTQALLCFDFQRHEDAYALLMRVASIAEDGLRAEASVYLAALHFLRGEHEACRLVLDLVGPMVFGKDFNKKTAKSYWLYLDKMPRTAPSPSESRGERLHVIGESHSLSLHGLDLSVDGELLLTQARWIIGCKQWHLANDVPNRYKQQFERVMQSLPPRTSIVTTIGEIDCRIDEGIFPIHKASGRDIQDMSRDTISGFVRYLADMVGTKRHKIIVSGVPCPNIDFSSHDAADIDLYLEFVADFNSLLKEYCLKAGFSFLDVHAMTDRGDGRSNRHWHLDAHHLHPNGWKEAFASYLLAAKVAVTTEPSPQVLIDASRERYGAGRINEAANFLMIAAVLDPGNDTVHYGLANIAIRVGDVARSVDFARRAIAVNDGHAASHNLLSTALVQTGRVEEGMRHLYSALRVQPHFTDALCNLGLILLQAAQQGPAEAALKAALCCGPAHIDAWNNLGLLHSGARRSTQSALCYRRSLAVNPQVAKPFVNMAVLHIQRTELGEAEAALRRALILAPAESIPLNNLGTVWQDQGRIEAALPLFERAIRLSPGFNYAEMNMIFSRLYAPGVGLERIHAEAVRRVARSAAPSTRIGVGRAADDRRPRIGMISSDFRRHAVGFLTVPAAEALARSGYSLVCYSNGDFRDSVADRFRAVAEWCPIQGQSDAAVAERIRADEIDILFDLGGFSAENRVSVFRHRPAPLQVAWAGYPATTGLPEMDYILADRWQIPGDLEHFYSEKVIRLPHSYIAYEPPASLPDPGPLPALHRGGVTFGSFNALKKISPQVVACWARVLNEVEGSRLLIKSPALGDAGTRDYVTELFARHGVESGRLVFLGQTDAEEHQQAMASVDIGLDPFPYTGGLTTLEYLWMGVPLVSLPGGTFSSRHSFGYLSTLGLTELIARDEDEYCAKLVGLATDLDRLSALRASLRPRLSASPLCDKDMFGRDLARALETIFKRWREGGGPAPLTLAPES